jgi:aerobic carbon-monoxide dehydrogenase medium subunit
MRPAALNYQRSTSLDEALQLLARPGAKAIAGGHSLIPPMNLRLSEPELLIDIGRLPELKGIRMENGSVIIGALSTHAEVARSSEVQTHAPALAKAASVVGDPQVRNWGTLGGNIAHADPASDPPTVLLAYDARIHIAGVNGRRVVAAGDFFKGLFSTDLQSGELITAIEIPRVNGKKSAYVKMSHPASRYAIVGVCVVLDMAGGTCTAATVAIGGAVASVMRSSSAEDALEGSVLDETALEAAAAGIQHDIAGNVMGDLFAPEAYRSAMAGVYLKRAVKAAMS